MTNFGIPIFIGMTNSGMPIFIGKTKLIPAFAGMTGIVVQALAWAAPVECEISS
jgi:hypothetical protein